MNQSQKAVITLRNRIVILISIAVICVAIFVLKNKDNLESGAENSQTNTENTSYPVSFPISYAE